MDSYPTERQRPPRSTSLAEEDAEIDPVLATAGGQPGSPRCIDFPKR